LVVADTTVWSNFAHAGRPRLVETSFAGVASPPAVLAVGVDPEELESDLANA
jgi:hypothetical protein